MLKPVQTVLVAGRFSGIKNIRRVASLSETRARSPSRPRHSARLHWPLNHHFLSLEPPTFARRISGVSESAEHASSSTCSIRFTSVDPDVEMNLDRLTESHT